MRRLVILGVGPDRQLECIPMIKRTFLVLIALGMAVSTGWAGDLYRVRVTAKVEAERLKTLGVEPLVQLPDGYVVYVESPKVAALTSSGLDATLIAANVSRRELALDNRLDRANVSRFPLLFQEGGIRIYRIDRAISEGPDGVPPVRSLSEQGVEIVYSESPQLPAELISRLDALSIPLDSLIAKVSLDSLHSYVLQLQSYPPRLAGSTANYNSRDWIASKLTSYGYDSVVTDSFMAVISSVPKPCQNVLAYKIGTKYPNHHIIVGAHHDAVSVSPGADDNGSGTAGVLEIARVLATVPTDVTFIYALFDAEESGLYGSYHYVSEAQERGDSIVYMLNMDMIGHKDNTDSARVFHGPLTAHSNLWIKLADSLLGVKGWLAGASSGSDHYPFTLKGYDASFIAEDSFSTVYHRATDSAVYMSFPYMTRLVKGSLATAYAISGTYQPVASLAITYPSGVPTMLTPDAATTFDASITPAYGGFVVPGSEKLYYGLNGNAYDSAALTPNGSGLYKATLPGQSCENRYRFYVGATEATNGPVYMPQDTARPNDAIGARASAIAFEDNFETDKGWVVTGAPADGPWTRGVPQGYGFHGDPVHDFDGSGQCWLTDNVIGNSDVDGGTTILTSPLFNISGANDAYVQLAVWYSNATGSAPYGDFFRIYITNDNGGVWTAAKVLGPVQYANGGWYVHAFWSSDFVAPTGQMRIRFEASDDINASVVEAAVDAIKVTTFTCVPPSCCSGTTGNVNMTGIVDLSDLSSLVSYLTGGGYVLPCQPEANVNAVGIVDLSDLSALVNYLTGGGYLLPNCV